MRKVKTGFSVTIVNCTNVDFIGRELIFDSMIDADEFMEELIMYVPDGDDGKRGLHFENHTVNILPNRIDHLKMARDVAEQIKQKGKFDDLFEAKVRIV